MVEGRKKGEGGRERRGNEGEGPAAVLLAAHRSSSGGGGEIRWGDKDPPESPTEDDAGAMGLRHFNILTGCVLLGC